MSARLTVSTECPTCGAPLDFSEGSNAIRCVHCRSPLLVTGRKQVLSYVIGTRVEERAAAAVVKFAYSSSASRAAITRIGLHFVPYYRLRAEDLRWERGMKEREVVDWAALQDNYVSSSFAIKPEKKEVEPIVVLRERRVEKNFLGCTLPGVPVYSLGVRASVLKLELLDRAALEARATIVATDVDAGAALARGLLSDDRDKLLHREVIGRELSLVYFPYWVAIVEGRGASAGGDATRAIAIVDGVTGAMVARDVDPGVLGALDRRETTATRTAGFRPLACPNCGWELPLEPDDVMFPCGSCERVWQIEGDRLLDVRYVVAAWPNGEAPPKTRYLPIWDMRLGPPAPCYVPAFRYRRLKAHHDLASNLSRAAPRLEPATGPRPPLHGSYLDEEDARALARFVRIGSTAKDGELGELPPFEVTGATLTWIPFASDGYSLREPFAGTSLPENLLEAP